MFGSAPSLAPGTASVGAYTRATFALESRGEASTIFTLRASWGDRRAAALLQGGSDGVCCAFFAVLGKPGELSNPKSYKNRMLLIAGRHCCPELSHYLRRAEVANARAYLTAMFRHVGFFAEPTKLDLPNYLL
jgi:hypothetical protein